MAYTAPDIKDQDVQYPNRFELAEVSTGIYDITPAFGTAAEAGTPVNKALLQPMADALAVSRHVKIKEYTSTANGVAQVNLDMTDVDFSLYAKVVVCIRDIYRTTAGTSGLLLLVNGSSASNYHYTYFGRGSAGGIAYQASQDSFNATGSGLDLSDTVSEKIDVELFAAGNYIYANIASAEWMIYGKYDVGSTATITALNVATPLGANLIKSGVKFYVYGVLK